MCNLRTYLITETMNWTFISFFIFLGLVLTGISTGPIYSLVTSDNSSAFSLGEVLAALFRVYFLYQFIACPVE